ncbi:MAG: hypothetical protein HY475_00110, partial [Candidatus Terrybacteria bacterium]|nr:hypothetical protein [Candidatus Terrybacteria bacterium]
LFAPCCIGFLLPSYLGTIFKERTRVLALTGVFALGIFAVFLPIGLGVGAVGSLFTRFHDAFFYLGSAMLIILGALLMYGKTPMFHLNLPNRAGRNLTVGTVFTLGIFSGIGSSCCAPVFAGVVTLSALAGSAAGGAIMAGAYVLGMVAPLFVLAWAIDRTKMLQRFTSLQRSLPWRIGSFRGETLLAHLIAGAIFITAGVLTAWLTVTGRVMSAVTWRDAVQVGWATKLAETVPWLGNVPDIVWLAAFALIVIALALAIRRSNRTQGR